jgi:hypothetical protein
MPVPQAEFVDAVRRGSGLTQNQIANLADINRLEYENAMQRHFGLSVEAAARLPSVLAAVADQPSAQGTSR